MDKDAITINEFCKQNSISRSHFYKLVRVGLGPDCMDVGGHKRISREAGGRWRRMRETAARDKLAATARLGRVNIKSGERNEKTIL